jgi:hypothetical protein
MATACPNIAVADKKISTRTVVMRDIIDTPLEKLLYSEFPF